MNKVSWISFLLLLVTFGSSNGVMSQTKVEAWDNSLVEVRQPDSSSIEKIKSNPEYQYEVAQNEASLWDRFLKWLRSFFGNGGEAGDWVVNLIIIVAVIAFAVIAFIIIGAPIQGLFIFRRNFKSNRVIFTSGVDDIHDVRLESMLKVFIESKAWREAVRVLYLLSLRELNIKGIIKWEMGKTNYEYLLELKGDTLKQQFKQATLHFEYAWYGQFDVSDQQFKSIQNDYFTLNQLIKS